jgi:3',5'-cyclic-nucleotide phosphodiesterase
MGVRVVGAHNMETRHTRHTCFLIDGVLGIDAGSLASALSPKDHLEIRALLITHAHLDHCRDVPTLGLSTLDSLHQIDIYALPETLESIRGHLMDGSIYPDLTEGLHGGVPRFRYHPVQPAEPFHVLGYDVMAVPARHPVPAVGYIVGDGNGVSVGYTGDTDGDLLPFFQNGTAPKTLFIDVTFPNRLEGRAIAAGHFTPALLGRHLRKALGLGLNLPRIIPVHMEVQYQDELAAELALEGAQLGIRLQPGYEDMYLE